MARMLEKLNITRADLGWLVVASIGLTLCLILNSMYDSTIMSRVTSATYGGVITSNPLSGGLAIIVVCAIATIILGMHRREPRFSTPIAVLFAALLAIPLGAMLFSDSRSVDDYCGLVLSATAIILLAFWVQALARAGRGLAFFVLAIALLLCTLCNAVISGFLAGTVGNVLLIILAVAAPFVLVAFERMAGPCQVQTVSHNATDIANPAVTTSGAPKRPSNSLGLPLARSSYDVPFWLAMAFIAVESFAMGHVQALGYGVEFAGVRQWIYTNSINIVTVVIAIFCLFCARMRDPHPTLRAIILVVLMFAVYLSTAIGQDMEPLGRLSMTTVRMLITVYLWLLACDIPWHNGWPMFAFMAGWGTFTFVNTMSTRIGTALEPGSTARTIYDLAIIASLAALVIMELVARRVYADGFAGIPGADSIAIVGTAAQGTQSSRQADNTDQSKPDEDPLLEPCKALAQQYGLTARELDVLVPLVHGRSAATIANLIGMSTETARTHIRHIYQKTDIHNREDLMDAVEEQQTKM